MTLTEHQKRKLRGYGQSMKPVVWLGAGGPSAAVIAELEQALDHHELVKVKLRTGDREARDQAISALCEASGAALIQRIGNIAVLFRRNEENPRVNF
jgi:RNA-binding protein